MTNWCREIYNNYNTKLVGKVAYAISSHYYFTVNMKATQYVNQFITTVLSIPL